MSFSETELIISNKSYINKDFPTIYNELLDTALKISKRFDPTTSNESDPFIVLTKLIALVGDKLNYNVDKNILERFLTSITQYNSMYERTSSLGYNMHYYQSSTGTINIKYNGNVEDIADNIQINFPALSTKLTTYNQDINFITLYDKSFNKVDLVNGNYKSVEVMQGELSTFKSLDGENKKILLGDLDNENRLYFPEVMVAENGVFISSNTYTYYQWLKVDNLNTQLPGTPCYVFRYDSRKKLPYIQFPEDISSLIEDGLEIKYIITNGNNGNISAKDISILLTNPAENDGSEHNDNYYSKDNYIISNPSSFTNGATMENIDEAYFNFQKTVGTFDTLVTCRDYANYIYNITDDAFKELCSNVQVCDRRDDYNFITKVATYNEYGENIEIVIHQEDNKDVIDAFDLMLYPLKPMIINDLSHYKESFTPLYNKAVIIGKLEESKCLSHNYKEGDIYAYKVYYQLNAKITTTTKVNDLEQLSIRNNVIQALIDNFNARMVDYGKEIPFDTILKVIENSDSRIKFVSLNEPILKVVELDKDENEIDIFLPETINNNKRLQYIANNVLAGTIPLYKYYDEFTFQYNETDAEVKTNIKNISTCARIKIPQNTNPDGQYYNENGYTLKQNEVVQILQPNLIEKEDYSYGWFYEYTNSQDTSEVLEAGIHKLGPNQTIKIYDYSVVDSANLKTTLTNCYIKCDFKIYQGYGVTSPQNKYRQINSGNNIITLDVNKIDIKERSNFYWVTNNIEIVTENGKEIKKSFIDWKFDDEPDVMSYYILNDGEYLYQTDNKYQELYVYGPGTYLQKRSQTNILKEKLEIINNETIEEDGLEAIKNLFVTTNLTSDIYLTILEQQILTFTEGDNLKSNDIIMLYSLYSDVTPYNTYLDLNNQQEINYILKDGTSAIFKPFDTDNYHTFIKARLDINCGPNDSQILLSEQRIYLSIDGQDYQIPQQPYLSTIKAIKSKYPIKLIGGNNISVESYSFADKAYISNDIYIYTLVNNLPDTDLTQLASIDEEGYYKLNVKDGEVNNKTSCTINPPRTTNKDTIIMMYCNPLSTDYDSNKNTITNVKDLAGNSITEINEKINMFVVNGNDITITFNGTFTGSIIISQPRIIDGQLGDETTLNSELKVNNSNDYTTFMSYINTYSDKFYYTTPINNSKSLDLDNGIDMNDVHNFFNINNVINKIVISEIDIDYASTNITIAKSSQL